jgi:DNA polymerase III subunit gamma/tau
MSYLVLARKYRPRNFSEMVGQEHVVRALSNALQTQRLHHAYLFTGTRGVGKTTVSRILAKSLNCQGADGQGGITATPCGVCQACTDIDSGRFVDYTELDAASNRGVDEVQALLEQAVYKPVQGRFKVFMIDEVHMLTGHAFNAMLKTLEEPPEYLKFVLATTDPQKVPVTVLSRCLQFNLRPMAPETILEHLVHVLARESIVAEPSALRLLARAARGSMRDALSLTDQSIAFGNGQIEVATVRQMLGSVDRSYVFRLIGALAQGNGKTVVETCEALRVNGISAASTLEEMSAMLQRMAVLQAVPDQAADSDPDAADIARLAATMPADETQLLYSLCLHGRAELGLAPDEYAALTMVLLRLLAFKPMGDARQLASASDSAEKKTLKPAESVAPAPTPTSAPAPVPARTPEPAPEPEQAPQSSRDPHAGQRLHVVDQPAQVHAPLHEPLRARESAAQGAAVPVRHQADSRQDGLIDQSSGAHLTPTPEGDVWHPLVQLLIAQEAIGALVRELALQSQLVAQDTDQWLLRVERESLNQANTRERLQAALQSIGHEVKLVIEVGRVSDSPAKRNAFAQAQRQQAAEKIILESPFVQSMMRDFGAKIVAGNVKPIEPRAGA